jgi:hypothetical protein
MTDADLIALKAQGIHLPTERSRRHWEAMTAEDRAASIAVIKAHRERRDAPGYREQEQRDIEAIMREHPPRRTVDPYSGRVLSPEEAREREMRSKALDELTAQAQELDMGY